MKYVVRATAEFVAELLTAGHEIRARCLTGIPDGARVVAASYAERENWITLTLEGEGPDDVITLHPTFSSL